MAEKEKLADIWPRTGPKKLWEAPVGSGNAGVAVSGQTVVVFHRLKDEEIVTALNAETGKPMRLRSPRDTPLPLPTNVLLLRWDTKPAAHQGDVLTPDTDTQNVFLCRAARERQPRR